MNTQKSVPSEGWAQERQGEVQTYLSRVNGDPGRIGFVVRQNMDGVGRTLTTIKDKLRDKNRLLEEAGKLRGLNGDGDPDRLDEISDDLGDIDRVLMEAREKVETVMAECEKRFEEENGTAVPI